MPKGISPTQRTLRLLRQEGCHCDIVERWNSFVGKFGIRQDLFGIIDLIALYPNKITGIQCCGSDFAAHDRKIIASEYSREWMLSGGALELWGWRKIKKNRGGKLMIWKPRIKKYTLEDLS